MLLHAIAEAAEREAGATAAGSAAFRAGYALLAGGSGRGCEEAGQWLLGLPHLGSWAHDCLIRLEQGSAADFGHFACLVGRGRGPRSAFRSNSTSRSGTAGSSCRASGSCGSTDDSARGSGCAATVTA